MSIDGSIAAQLADLLQVSELSSLTQEQSQKFALYISLILRWNAKTNLTAIRDEAGILSRHFVECIACAQALPEGIHSLLDFGSGAGFPGLPIAICRPEISVTLAESQGKKAAFLQEVARVLDIEVRVFGGRAEKLHIEFDCVTLRAVDRMREAVAAAASLVKPSGWLALMTTTAETELLRPLAGQNFQWERNIALPGGENRILSLGCKSPPAGQKP